MDLPLPRLSIRWKLLVAFVGLSVIPVAVLGTWGLYGAERALRASAARHQAAQFALVAAATRRYIGEIVEAVELLGRRAGEAHERGHLRPDGRRALAEAFHLFARLRSDVLQVRFLRRDGMELVRINRDGPAVREVPEADLQFKGSRYYVRDVLASALPYVSPVDPNVEHGKIETPERLVFRVGLRVDLPGDGPVGAVVVNVAADGVLELVARNVGPSVNAVFLADASGSAVVRTCENGSCTERAGGIEVLLPDIGGERHADIRMGRAAHDLEVPGGLLSLAPLELGSAVVAGSWRFGVLSSERAVVGPVREGRRWLVTIAVLLGAAALGLALLAARTLVRPIEDIVAFLRRVGHGELGNAPRPRTGDEIQEIAESAGRMAAELALLHERMERWNQGLRDEVDRQVARARALHDEKLAVERQVLQADRLSSLGLLSASLAHEVGNPLAAIKTVLQVQLRSTDLPDRARVAIDRCVAEVDRLAGILHRITGYARPGPAERARTTPRDLFERIRFLVEREARRKGVALSLGGEAVDRPIVSDRPRLEQVLLNLLVNAVQAVPHGGRVEVRAAGAAGSPLRLAVADDGPGIPVEDRARIFEPWFTTKEGGTGLGLPIVRKIVGELGGEVRMEAPGIGARGATFVVTLETAGDFLPAQEAGHATEDPARGGRRADAGDAPGPSGGAA